MMYNNQTQQKTATMCTNIGFSPRPVLLLGGCKNTPTSKRANTAMQLEKTPTVLLGATTIAG
jgi:hypothetical protein